MLICIDDACALMGIKKAKFRDHVERGTIPKHCDKVMKPGGMAHLWHEADIKAAIDVVKNYKRGSLVSDAKKAINKARSRSMNSIDKVSPIFNAYLRQHYAAISKGI